MPGTVRPTQQSDQQLAALFDPLWNRLQPIGRDARTGGYHRFAWTSAELECREWFHAAAAARGLDVETDRNGNLWAWWSTGNGEPADAIITGSHLDSVPAGGAYDGPLGVASGFVAIDLLRARGVRPDRPIAVAAFADEEGSRFGVACAGSRLLAGTLDPGRARGLIDADGTSLAEAMTAAGHDPAWLGRDEAMLDRIGVFVELHVEQGRALVDQGAAVGVASAIWPHGRWRFDFAGEANHAGTTRLEDRDDPTLPYASSVLAARAAAQRAGALATFGKVLVEPNGTNAIPSAVHAWLDARGPDEDAVRAVLAELEAVSGATVTEESYTAAVQFEPALRKRLASLLGDVPVLPTGAGHDAGILNPFVPTAMLFVRNPTGISHSPVEFAEPADCLAGADALATVLADLACR